MQQRAPSLPPVKPSPATRCTSLAANSARSLARYVSHCAAGGRWEGRAEGGTTHTAAVRRPDARTHGLDGRISEAAVRLDERRLLLVRGREARPEA